MLGCWQPFEVVILDSVSGIDHLHLEVGYTGAYGVWSSIEIALGIIRPSGKKIDCQPLVEVEANGARDR